MSTLRGDNRAVVPSDAKPLSTMMDSPPPVHHPVKHEAQERHDRAQRTSTVYRILVEEHMYGRAHPVVACLGHEYQSSEERRKL